MGGAREFIRTQRTLPLDPPLKLNIRVFILTSSSSFSDCLATNADGMALARFDAAIVCDTTHATSVTHLQSMLHSQIQNKRVDSGQQATRKPSLEVAANILATLFSGDREL